jgi:hypothetical protein
MIFGIGGSKQVAPTVDPTAADKTGQAAPGGAGATSSSMSSAANPDTAAPKVGFWRNTWNYWSNTRLGGFIGWVRDGIVKLCGKLAFWKKADASKAPEKTA